MACVADDETDIIAFGKFNARNYIINCRDIDCVSDVISQETRLRLGSERVTTLICKVWRHNRRGG
jgi:hypothetical protein